MAHEFNSRAKKYLDRHVSRHERQPLAVLGQAQIGIDPAPAPGEQRAENVETDRTDFLIAHPSLARNTDNHAKRNASGSAPAGCSALELRTSPEPCTNPALFTPFWG